jgi:hypothetical protein
MRAISNGLPAVLRLHKLKRHQPSENRTCFPGVDIWRWQYFEDIPCPPSVIIPVDDPTGWRFYPQHRTIYNKLFISDSQGISCGPHGVTPDRFPVLSKPIINLHGMGTGSRTMRTAAELDASFTPGYMWMELFSGEHVSTDVALARGRPGWWRHTIGKPGTGGTFDYWTVLAERRPGLEECLHSWIRDHLRGFTGIVNLETIGGKIIDVHLRMGEQWADLNGPGWLESVVELYAHGRWRYADRLRRTGYSVVLFGRHGPRYQIAPDAVTALRAAPGISSIQITFDSRKPPEQHAMPPGGFRLAIVNCWDLDAGRAVRDRLRILFQAVEPHHNAGRLSRRTPSAGRRG